MKRTVWKNKSDGQLCLTIPQNSGIKEGDTLDIKRSQIRRISYIGVVADLFHYGHLKSIKFAKSISDYLICGVFTDEAVEEYRIKPISNIKERKKIIESLNFVDKTIIQEKRDPTENLKKIHQEYPNAELILVHGDNWKKVPGSKYIKEISGKIITHPYYSKLSTFKIINHMIENQDKYKDITKFSSLIKKTNGKGPLEIGDKTIISTKADTLRSLKTLLRKSKIETMFSFTITDWKNKQEEIVEKIKREFNQKIVIRSSAMNEDTLDSSMAGCFESYLDIDSNNEEKVKTAIEMILDSYKKKKSESSFNQVLIQSQTENVNMSGVIFTKSIERNSPYYIINYDDKTGSTDSVTAGREGRNIKIFNFTEEIPNKFSKLIEAIKEIESLIPEFPLDIEFAINDKNEIIIFQVRPLAVNINKKKNDLLVTEKIKELKNKFIKLKDKPLHLEGEKNIFADMPDWNPAEIIGNKPNHLDYSLYDYIITNDSWHKARTIQGYSNVSPAKLVEIFGGKPFVNVRNTFNSFIPASLSQNLRKKLVNFYIKKLSENPHLQDKVEFEILFTCYDFNFEERAKELLRGDFNEKEVLEIKRSLIKLTNNLIINYQKEIDNDFKSIFSLEENRIDIDQIDILEISIQKLIDKSKVLLDDCKEKGTIQFSKLARLGFIAKIMLKSLVENKVITQDEFDLVYNSINTVATDISKDFEKLSFNLITKKQFIKKYYHLRPGTYDITSLRYNSNHDLIKTNIQRKKEENINRNQEVKNYSPDKETIDSINMAFEKKGFTFTAEHFLNFVKSATEARELSKFEFTKNLSDALELIALSGELMGFTRKELAQLDIKDIFKINIFGKDEKIEIWKDLIKKREKINQENDLLILPSIITSEKDFEIIEHYQAKPNFITQKIVESRVININENKQEIDGVQGNIVLIENGDPGYDWIFTRNPSGLITKYGGIASHMSIRCAEFGIPAAIGCGEDIFNMIKKTEKVRIDCRENKITPLS